MFELGMHNPEIVEARRRVWEKPVEEGSNAIKDLESLELSRESLERGFEKFQNNARRDVDLFTRGVNEVFDWMVSETSNKKETIKYAFQRLKLVFGIGKSKKPDE